MATKARSKIYTHLWYAKEAEEAASFYASIFPDSRVERVTPIASDSPSGPAGSVDMVEFTLFGQPFKAISAGPARLTSHPSGIPRNVTSSSSPPAVRMRTGEGQPRDAAHSAAAIAPRFFCGQTVTRGGR